MRRERPFVCRWAPTLLPRFGRMPNTSWATLQPGKRSARIFASMPTPRMARGMSRFIAQSRPQGPDNTSGRAAATRLDAQRADYVLTAKGRDLGPIVGAMVAYGLRQGCSWHLASISDDRFDFSCLG